MNDREALQDKIARAIHEAHCFGEWDKDDCSDYDEPHDYYLRSADAVMPIVEQLQADNEALRQVVAKVTAIADSLSGLREEAKREASHHARGRAYAYDVACHRLRAVLAEVTP